MEPSVLLLDEPLSALDAKVRVSLREEIRRLQIELGVTTLFVTHDQEEALSMADRVAVLRAGRVEQVGTPDRIYERPATAFVAEFIGSMNHIPGVVEGDRVAVLGQYLPIDGDVPAATDHDVLVRPEAVRLQAAPDGAGLVTRSSFRGATARLHVELNGLEIQADVPGRDATALAPGARVDVSLDERPALVTARGATAAVATAAVKTAAV
jgi:putative spermidine/putrescine transport system ATP-binding protein